MDGYQSVHYERIAAIVLHFAAIRRRHKDHISVSEPL